MKEIGLRSYQDIKIPEEIDEESRYESILESLLQDYDPDCGNYKAYLLNCRKKARRLAKLKPEDEEE